MGQQNKAAADYTSTWLQNYHSEYPSYSSQAPSQMSFASSVSKISVDTVLTVVTEIPSNEGVHASSASASASSYSENADPMIYQRINEYISQMTMALYNEDESAKRKALSGLYSHAKYFAYVTDIVCLQMMIDQLFRNMAGLRSAPELVNRALSILYEVTRRPNCMYALHGLIRHYDGKPVHILCHFLNPSEKYCNYVMSILYTLFAHKEHGRSYRNCARHVTVVQRLMDVASSSSSMHRYIALDNVRLLMTGHSELKGFFVKSSGMEVCLSILERETNERLLFAAVSVIGLIFTGQDPYVDSDVAHFIRCGGVQILGKLLDHGSPRLLRKIMYCLCSVSDSSSLAELNFDIALYRTVQVLGSADTELVHDASGFLMNASAQNRKANKFLHDNNAIHNLTSLASMMSLCLATTVTPTEKKLSHGILEHSLRALVNLTQRYEDDTYVFSACQQLLQPHNDVHPLQPFLNVLDYSSADLVETQSSVVKILTKIIEKVDAQCANFVGVYASTEGGGNFASVTLRLLARSTDTMRWTPEEKRSDKLKLRTLIHLLLKLINLLLGNEVFLRDFALLSRRHGQNPVKLVRIFDDLELEVAAMTMIYFLAKDTELASFWMPDSTSIKIFNLCLKSDQLQLREAADSVRLRLIGVNNGMR
ncbi:beta-catenin [Aphelenchoides avenae]|nr:beta-catenin [Aphelenchus avenae]